MKNVVEDHVASLFRELEPGVKDSHRECPLCREDVLVFALNRLPPHYVSTLKGEVLSRLDIQAGQSGTDATVAMLEGFRFVAANPRCGRKAV
jgi:competence protein ComFB